MKDYKEVISVVNKVNTFINNIFNLCKLSIFYNDYCSLVTVNLYSQRNYSAEIFELLFYIYCSTLVVITLQLSICLVFG